MRQTWVGKKGILGKQNRSGRHGNNYLKNTER